MDDSEDVPIGSTTTHQIDWRVVVRPADDWEPDSRPSPDLLNKMVSACIREFKKKLKAELKRGHIIVGYGPIVDTISGEI